MQQPSPRACHPHNWTISLSHLADVSGTQTFILPAATVGRREAATLPSSSVEIRRCRAQSSGPGRWTVGKVAQPPACAECHRNTPLETAPAPPRHSQPHKEHRGEAGAAGRARLCTPRMRGARRAKSRAASSRPRAWPLTPGHKWFRRCCFRYRQVEGAEPRQRDAAEPSEPLPSDPSRLIGTDFSQFE